MKLIVTARFKVAYKTLPIDTQKKANKAIKLLSENPRYPSLHLKKIQGTSGIWEVRVDRSCCMTLEVHSDFYVLRNLGKHDETLGNP